MDRSQTVNARMRRLPPVDTLVQDAGNATDLARWSLLAAARSVLEEARSALLGGSEDPGFDLDDLPAETERRARRMQQPWPQRVINGTGIVLHTNLGRAPLSTEAAAEVAHAASGYSDLELDLETGQRGSRGDRVAELLRVLANCEAAHVVNNTAAALMLAVNAIAPEREVVLSRGELVEIGGSFRVPEIMASTRARLREIGTTNRTHLRDYANAICAETGMLLKVHRSNFSIDGFTTEVGLSELSELGREHDIPVVEDRGSGSFIDMRPHGIPEAEAWSGLREGADLVLFSGDKLLGGPQAGIILGRADLIAKIKRHPVARAMRVDKMTLAALHWTLRALLDGREAQIPVVGMLTSPVEQIEARARRLAAALEAGGASVEVLRAPTSVGGGSLPEVELESVVVRVDCESGDARIRPGAGTLAKRLRTGSTPILVRVHKDALQIDARTLQDSEIGPLAEALTALLR